MTSLHGLLVLMSVVYVAESVAFVEHGRVVFVGWRAGGWARRRGMQVHLRSGRTLTTGRILPPLDPPVVAAGSRMDRDALLARHAALIKVAAPLRWLSNALFAALFVGLPACLLIESENSPLGLITALTLALWLTTGIVLVRVARRLYPDSARRPSVLTTLASPLSMVRAVDVVAGPLFSEFHPLAFAHALGRHEDFVVLARLHLFDARSATMTRDFLRSVGALDLVDAAPAADPSCRSYCPRCHAQFQGSAGNCTDCGVVLRARTV